LALNRRQFVGALSAAAMQPLTAPARAQAAPVRVGFAFSDSYAETLFANDGRFFQRAGIDVELTFFTNSQAQVTALAGNAIDVGTADVIQIANAINGGVALGILAGGSVYDKRNPTTLLCVAKGSPVRSARDLEGGTIAIVSLAGIGSITVQRWLQANGADPKSVKFLEMPFSPMAAALDRGTVAAALIGEPFLTAARVNVRSIGDTYPQIADAFYVSLTFASLEWVARNREMARRVARAMYDAGRWANAHRDDTAAILSKRAKVDMESIRAMNRSVFATTPPDRRLIQPVLDLGFAYHQIAKPLQAAEMITTI
jgi:NitT/TauT family transport system substrate-binding protein